ncbi:uncharacterized protein IL334_007629 [Kwoniella shivajii]|uniref:WLM domain-containing protein n=1 Tax=Kwoniella shivajii TaxID=564305 RepID=A0ABZ1D965_9TREE|nr:hypothetical protein IL334_007629 [Kwoniella shivajii]
MSSPTLSEMEFPSSPPPPPPPPPPSVPAGREDTYKSITPSEHNKSITKPTPSISEQILKKDKKKSISSKKAQIAKQNDFKPSLTRYLPPCTEEAFIGPLLSTTEDTIRLIQSQCPSLAGLPSRAISLRLRFDGNTTLACNNVFFRVLDECWPTALHEVLHLVHVDVDPSASSKEKEGIVGNEPKTIVNRLINQSQDLVDIGNGIGNENHHYSFGVRNEKVIHPIAADDALRELTWDDLKKNGELLGVQSWTDNPSSSKRSEKSNGANLDIGSLYT